MPGKRDFGGAFLRVAAQISDGASNEDKRCDGDDDAIRINLAGCTRLDCLLHWASVVHQRSRVTALLLWSKPLGEQCFESRFKASRSLKGKDDPLGRYAFTTWEGGRSYKKSSHTEVAARE